MTCSTTQYLEEVDQLCDRLSVIRDGEIIATDSPEKLKSDVGGDILDLTLEDTSEQESATSIIRESDALETATIETMDDGLTITSEDARESVSELFVSLHDAGVVVTGFDIRSPTLDDVFLALTGERPETSDGNGANASMTTASEQEVAE